LLLYSGKNVMLEVILCTLSLYTQICELFCGAASVRMSAYVRGDLKN
jgi:hypothetical protein